MKKLSQILKLIQVNNHYSYQHCSSQVQIAPQKDFSITQAFRHMQRGLASIYKYINFVSIIDIPEILCTNTLLDQLSKIYIQFNDIKTNKNLDYCVVLAFDINLWNKISHQNLKVAGKQCFGRPFKDNIKLLFIVKGRTQQHLDNTTIGLQNSLNKIGVSHNLTKGFMNGDNLVLAGRFNDGMQVVKDPYSFYLNALIGYEDIRHIGGSYVIAQKSKHNWGSFHQQHENLSTVVGRKDNIEGYNSIFSQHFAQNSHSKRSRTKDEYGNPVIMARQSKLYTQVQPVRATTDPIKPEQGVYFVGFLNKIQKIQNIVISQQKPRKQEQKGFIGDHLISNISVSQGNILFIPSSANLKVHLRRKQSNCDLNQISQLNSVDWRNDFPGMKQRSSSPYMFYSRSHYMQIMSTFHIEENPEANLQPPTPRILRIISKTFNLWADTWYHNRKQQQLKHLKEYLQIYQADPIISSYKQTQYKDLSIPIRSGLAMYVALGHVFVSEEYGCRGLNSKGEFGAGYYNVQPEDILVGGQPNLSFGQGKYVIDYLTQEETLFNWMNGINLSADSGVGHVVPHYTEIIEIGLGKLLLKYQNRIQQLRLEGAERSRIQFFQSSHLTLKGMQIYLVKYQELVRRRLQKLKPGQLAEIANLQQVAERLHNIQTQPPKTFQQAAQIVLTVYTCLHLIGQPVSIGRLDRILAKFVQKKIISEKHKIKYQQTIDHFFIKVGQKVLINRAFVQDHQKFGNLAMGGSSAPFPQGASINQWGQQLTVGGLSRQGTPGQNLVTLLVLKAARRLPFNAPCVGLRVHKNTPQIYLDEAAKAILSGGAHPVLLNDDKIIPGNLECGKINLNRQKWDNQTSVDVPYQNWNSQVSIQDARDYTSDGCYQVLFSGNCWFALTGQCLLQPLQYVLNEGKSIADAGPRYLYGKRNFFIWKRISEIKTYQQLEQLYLKFLKLMVSKNWTMQLYSFGKVTTVCPGSLLNVFTLQTFQRQADFYSNGPKYNLFNPQLTGFSNVINAMYNLKKLIFEQKQTTLYQVRGALLCNWGQNLIQPFIPISVPQISKLRLKRRYEDLRKRVWGLPKYGFSPQVSEFGNQLARKITKVVVDVFTDPAPQTIIMFKTLTKAFSSGNRKTFGIQLLPGCGTFEGYLDSGIPMGASFDGRKKSDALAQDFSRQPSLADQQLDLQDSYIQTTLKLYTQPGLWSGSVLDLNIDQDYEFHLLVKNIKQFADGDGPNILTITACDLPNIIQCYADLDKDLIRLRMGGWSQYAVAMFPELLKQQIRRPRSISTTLKPMKEKLRELYASMQAKKIVK